jgi:hypothetical protein
VPPALVRLLGYSATAVGGGGLGDLGIRYGYQRFMPEMMLGGRRRIALGRGCRRCRRVVSIHTPTFTMISQTPAVCTFMVLTF